MFLKFLLVLLLIVFYINNQFAAPRIGIDVPAIEFGDVEANSKLVREVRIANSGDEQLSVSRVKACCGANASLAETTIASGTSSVLRVEFNPDAKPGPFRKTVTLYSNDPVSPVLIIPLVGSVKDFMVKEQDGKAILVSEVPESAPPETQSSASTTVDCTLPVVLFAGFVDGFNPCAFSIVIALAGILAVGGRRRRARLLGGTAFCVGSYLTYMAMGFGLLAAIRSLSSLDIVRDVLFAFLSLALAVLSLLSLRDAWRYHKARVPAVITLQLPDGVKRAIRAVAEASWSGPAVIGTGLVCGFVVTLLDSLCTGQVYLPVLAMLARDSHSLRAFILLALYNLAFIAPLVAVFVLAAKGADSERMSRWSKRNVVPSKIFLALVFALLAILLFPRDLSVRFTHAVSGPMRLAPASEHPASEHEITTSRLPSHPYDSGVHTLTDAELAELNTEIDTVLREDPPDEKLIADIIQNAEDKSLDPNLRNYCVQVLPECRMRVKESSPLCEVSLSVLRKSLRERSTLLPGTALLGLGRIAAADESFADEFANAVLAVASDADMLSENRVTAIRLAVERGIPSVLVSARHWAKHGETALLRDVAADAVRELVSKPEVR